MDLFLLTFEAVAVLLGISIIGFYLSRRGILSDEAFRLLSPLSLEIALPCLIFSSIITQFNPQQTTDWWILPLWWLLFTVLALALSLSMSLIAKKNNRREFAVSLFYQNAIFIPLAILTGMYGQNNSYLVVLFLFTLLYSGFFFNTYQFFFTKQKYTLNIKKIFHPVLIATIIAIVVRLLNLQTFIPTVATSIIGLLGAMSLPLIMILLGGYIASDFKQKGTIDAMEVTKFVIVKNLMFPLVFFVVLYYLRPVYPVALIFFIQSAIPPVTTIPLVVERAGGNRSIVDQFLVGSFLFSLVSLPLMILLFATMYPNI